MNSEPIVRNILTDLWNVVATVAKAPMHFALALEIALDEGIETDHKILEAQREGRTQSVTKPSQFIAPPQKDI